MRWLGDLLFRNWGTKIIAVVLATVVFVVTRDEVVREFDLPLRAISDPDRVLQTQLPTVISVQIRGPWTRVSRLLDSNFEPVKLDLSTAEPGPLEIDRSNIVMPAGVLLAGVRYDHVDLRFEDVVARRVIVAPPIAGKPGPDYRLARVDIDPPQLAIRGGRSAVHRVDRLVTEPLDISETTVNVTQTLAVVRPSLQVRFEPIVGEVPTVNATAVIEPIVDKRDVRVAVSVSEALARRGVPAEVTLQIIAARRDLRALDRLELPAVVQGRVATRGGRKSLTEAELRFSWAPGVPASVSDRLKLDPVVLKIELERVDKRAEVAPGSRR